MSAATAALSPDDQRAFRQALGHFATGVAIVTADTAEGPIGSTISSFNSVSLDPPLVLFSLISESLGIAKWRQAEALCVSILAEPQIAMSNRFAKAGTDKWDGVEEIFAPGGARVIPGCLCYFDCTRYALYDGGDHDIFVCRVTSFHTLERAPAPLVFHAGQYRQLIPLEGHSKPPADNLWLHGW